MAFVKAAEPKKITVSMDFMLATLSGSTDGCKEVALFQLSSKTLLALIAS
jgi:hypothetical protein